MTLEQEVEILKQLPVGAMAHFKASPDVFVFVVEHSDKMVKVLSQSRIHSGWVNYNSLTCDAIDVFNKLKQ